ncbi:rhamnose ABC transporter substrate-binding protein [Schaalia sp. 19OD2882]|uniref:rhamnose ABC transporter substrate-binding protein n=1 Tax=Schaalia sp. 19OD2882 TaxID=2794089 RepID=UPI001C1E91EF|nr:rhamnose ABC transporter substrate-binding protein [Schaalia sp. 19OD2882]QWW19469.1 rhamnose ABC transporter substrate-binding protein [Schaalia sp. 19OD2882]
MSLTKRGSIAALAAFSLAATMALAACSGATGSGPASGAASGDSTAGGSSAAADPAMAEQTITFIPKQLNNPYTDVVLGGGKKGAEEIGFAQANVVGPLEASASSQVSFINAETQAGTNVIVLAANDPDAVCPALEEARKGGAKIVTFDSDTNPKCRDLFISQVVAKDVAKVQVQMISEQIGGEGDIAILSATANATNQNEWIKYMEEELASNPEYSKIKIVAKVYGDDDDTKSFQEAQGLMQANPNLKGIISPTTVGIAATARYLSTSEYKGKVALTGLGLPNEMRSFVKDGTVKEFALWDPAQLGYLASYAGKALAAGRIEGKVGDTFAAGELGERTVEDGGIVIVGEPVRFNKDNIDKYDF